MRSRLIPLAFLSLAGFAVGQGCTNVEAGTHSGVICVSKTQYFYQWQDQAIATPEECRNGTVCANVVEMCSNTSQPVCNNTDLLTPGTCNACIDLRPNRVCISATSYSVCNQGVVQPGMNKSCPSSAPFCKAVFDANINVIEICQTDTAKLDCSGSSDPTIIPPTTPPPGNFTCTESGFFADPRSTDCTRYFKCQAKTIGGYDQLTFTCSIAGHKFNPSKVKCESNYICR